MYLKSKLSLACLSLCCFLPAFAQEKAAAPKTATPKATTAVPTSTTSTFEIVRKDGRDVFTTTNRKFNYVPLYTVETYKSLLLLEEIRSEVSPDVEGSNGAIKVDAWLGKGSKPDKKAWTIKSDATAGEAGDIFYKTTNFGCCASYNVYTWYNLLTGQKIYTGTNNFIKISVPNSGGDALDRYVTFHSREGTIDTPEIKRLKDVIGVIEYGTTRRVTHRIIVRTSDQANLEAGVPEMGVAHKEEMKFVKEDQEEVTLWGSNNKTDKSALTDFTVILKWEENKQIVIPFKNDAPVLGEAKLPAKITVEIPVKQK